MSVNKEKCMHCKEFLYVSSLVSCPSSRPAPAGTDHMRTGSEAVSVSEHREVHALQGMPVCIKLGELFL